MGQFVEYLDEKNRFIDVRYVIDATDSPIATSHSMSVLRQAQYTAHINEGNPYYHLELLAHAQDMAEDFGFDLFLSGTSLEKKIDDRQLELHLCDD